MMATARQEADREAVLEVLERIRAGWEQLDPELVLSAFALESDTVVIGTDAPEYWIGYPAFAEPFRQMGGAFEDGRYSWDPDEPLVSIEGNCAWVTGKLTGSFVSDGERVTLAMRTTHALVKKAARWLVVQAHYSLPAAESTPY